MSAPPASPQIVRLSQVTINRIAAGEVVERPASVVKELVENALDAGATEVTVRIEAGGKDLISVSDNGCGMDAENLAIAVENHTTSKLRGDDLLNLQHLGFRGEAVASIGSVSKLTIRSRPANSDDGHTISVLCGVKTEPAPVPHHCGTTVEVRDLFCAIPARLKFLRADRTEQQYMETMLKKIAIAHPAVAFKFIRDGKTSLSYSASDQRGRVADVFGQEFLDNSIEIDGIWGDMRLTGYASLPTYTRATYNEQYLYINNRPVRDRLLLAYVKSAYQDMISRDKSPVTVLFLEIPSEMVDVNVHPAKAEVRFRDIQSVRALVLRTLQEALTKHGGRTAPMIAEVAMKQLAGVTDFDRELGSRYEPWNTKAEARRMEELRARMAEKAQTKLGGAAGTFGGVPPRDPYALAEPGGKFQFGNITSPLVGEVGASRTAPDAPGEGYGAATQSVASQNPSSATSQASLASASTSLTRGEVFTPTPWQQRMLDKLNSRSSGATTTGSASASAASSPTESGADSARSAFQFAVLASTRQRERSSDQAQLSQASLGELRPASQSRPPRLGRAIGQVHQCYIISETPKGIVITDQHAAHERICYEKLKQQVKEGSVHSQLLLMPEVIELDNHDLMERLLALKDKLPGLRIERHSDTAVQVTEVPQLLGNCDVRALIMALVDSLAELEDDANSAEVLTNKLLGTYACHTSIRSGRTLTLDEMNELLRQMDQFPRTGCCNHGRPTHVEFTLSGLERMFERG